MKTQTARLPLPATEFVFAGFSWPRYVATLPAGTLRARLANAKNRCTGPYYHAPKPSSWRNKERGFYLDDVGMPLLRWQWAYEVARSLKHKGWYVNDFCDPTIRGLVFRLPRGRGFLAAYSMGEGMSSVVECHIYSDEIDAAYAADRMAEIAAEREREYNERHEGEE